ncbi:MAG: hypothetical protein LUF90_11440 [Rikenellaceae bacterium]|nr:hypothetical protein [Rikenellaceae bacterium]
MFNSKTLFFSALIIVLSFSACKKHSDDDDVVGPGIQPYPDSSKWISEIIEYRPAPGQFINTASGTMTAANSIVGGEGLVSLGGFGGYIIFRFDHSVQNIEGYDFAIKGNAFDGSSEPGIVMVSFDTNGNGLPDDEWYEIAGENHANAEKDYTIIYKKPSQTDESEDIFWESTDGTNGYIYTENLESFHSQSFWPLFLSGENLIFSGTCLGNLVEERENGDYYLAAAGKGYADNFSEEYTYVVNGDEDTYLSNKFDISDAVDALGRKANLKAIDFIKVYTGVNQQAGHLGELSTEIRGAISFTVKN